MRYYFIIGWLISFLLVACNKEEVGGMDEQGLPASLSISLKAGELSVDARSIVDPNVELDQWTAMERAIDGREMYRLTLFLVNKKNTLVAYRDLYKGSGDIDDQNGFWTGVSVGQNLGVGSQAKVTFDFNKTKHGNIEKLTQGEYLLIAVANYSNYTDPAYSAAPTYDGLKNGDFTTLVEGIIANFNKNKTTGLANFSFANKTQTSAAYKFFHYDLDAGTDFVCPLQPQPLVLTKKISLRPGHNSVSANLKRTYARIRINLFNNSDKSLQNNGLRFEKTFAKRYTYLFEDPDDANFVYNYPGNKSGSIDVKSADAIIPYQTSILDAKSSQILFDGYILESKGNAENYKYQLNVGYGPAAVYLTTDPITRVDGLGEWITLNNDKNNVFFLIRGRGIDYYLGDDNKSKNVIAQQWSGTSLEDKLWKVSVSGSQYTLKSAHNRYIGQLYKNEWWGASALSDIELKTGAVTHSFADKSSGGASGISIADAVSNDKTFYLAIEKNTYNVQSYKGLNGMPLFEFYPVEVKFYPFDGTAVDYNQPIQLQTIDPVTAQVKDVTNIKRNDFINIYINSSYSDANGIFNFEVMPWVNKGGEIEYN